MGITLNYIETNNSKVYYRVSGAEHSRTIVFVHGLAADSRFFHNQLKFFGNSMKVIAIDLPGHGRSRNPGILTAEAYSRSIEQVIARENVDSYILAGHSMGGAICLEHYKNNHNRIDALILISTAAKIPVTAGMVSRSENDFESFFDQILGSIFKKKAGIFILAAKKNLDDDEKTVITSDLKICMGMDQAGVLESINIPVLILANRYDSMIPAELTAGMQSKISGSRLVVFENTGHIPFFEDSEIFNAAVLDFINSIQ